MNNDTFNYIITGILNLDTTKATKEAQKFEKTMWSEATTSRGKTLHKVTQQVIEDLKLENGNVLKVAKSFDQYYNKFGQAVDANGKFVKSGTRLNEVVLQTGRNLTELSMKLKTTSDSTNIFKNAFANLGETMVKVAKFKIATDIFGAIIDSADQAKQAVEEFDKALTEYKKVSDLDGGELNDYTEKLGELGDTVGRTRSMMVESATEFKKSGFSDADSAMLAQQAEMFRNISDEEMTASESAKILIGTMKGFGKSAEDVSHIEDVINEVSNTSAVSSSDIANGLANVSAVAHTTGASLEETTGMLTSMVEVTQSAGKSSRGLRQIFTRLFQTLDSGSSTGKKLKEIYADLGIELTDMSGNLRDPMEIFTELSEQWDSLSKNQQEYIALTSAGANQIQNFTALMSNFDKALEATETAYNSEGSAMKENARYMESIEAQQTLLKKQLEDLVLGNGGLQSLEKILLKIANAVLKVLNNKVVQSTIKLGLLFAVLTKFPVILTVIIAKMEGLKLIKWLKGIEDITLATEGLTIASKGLSAVLTIIETHPIALAITAIVGTIAIANEVLKKQKERIDDTSQSLKKYQSEVDGAKDKIDKLNKDIEKLNEKKSKTSDKKEIEELENKIIKKQHELDIEERLLEVKKKNAKEDSKKDLGKTVKTTAYAGNSSAVYEKRYSNQVDALRGQIEGIEEIDKKIKNMKSQLAKAEKDKDEYTAKMLKEGIAEDLDNRDKILASGNKLYKNLIKAKELGVKAIEGENIDKVIKKFENLDVVVDGTKEKFKNASEVYKKLGVPAEEMADRWTGTAEQLKKFQDLMEDDKFSEAYALAMKNCDNATGDFAGTLKETMGDALENVNNVQDAYNTLSGIVDDFNDNGVVSLDSLNTLFTKYPEYIKYLEFEGNQLKLNKNGIDAIANARLDEAEAEVYDAYTKEVNAIKTEDLKNKTYDSAKASQTQSNISKKQKATLETLISTLYKGEKAWIDYNSAELNGGYKVKKKGNKKALKSAQSNLYKSLKLLDSARGKMGSFTKSIDANTKATKSNTGAQKENRDAIKALEDEVKNYEKVIKYIESKFDQQIDKIKELKDTEINSIKDRIEALKELRDKEVEAIEAKVNALEEQNQALEEQKELEELLNNVAKASTSKVKIYRDGRFVYDRNQEEYNSARKALNEYLTKKKLQDEIDMLNKHKDELKANYDKQIKDLEDFQKKREAYYDAQIKYWQDYKKHFDDMTKAYENEQNRLLALQLTGIDFENKNWTTRIGNLTSFVNAYIQKLRELQNAQAQYNASQRISSASGSGYSGSSGGGGGGGSRGGGGGEPVAQLVGSMGHLRYGSGISHQYWSSKKGKWVSAKTKGGHIYITKKEGNQAGDYIYGTNSNGTQIRFKMFEVNAGVRSGRMSYYAKGSNYIDSDQMAIVGDAPNSELVIGSSLNSGVPVGLQKGSGVLNATATSALMNFADKLRVKGVDAVANDFGENHGENITMDIANVAVNANNANEFIDSMREFKNSVIQRTYI